MERFVAMIKPIKPYVDYYLGGNADVNNCRYADSDKAFTCRYVRISGDSCEKLDHFTVYSDKDFTIQETLVSETLGNNARVIMTNCSNVSTYNYNPGIENIAMANCCLLFTALIIIVIWKTVKFLISVVSR